MFSNSATLLSKAAKTAEKKTARTSLESIVSMNMKVALAVRNKSQTDLARGLGVSSGVISQNAWKDC